MSLLPAPTPPTRRALAAVPALALLLGGCASVLISQDHLQQRTATALGLDAGEFTISNRSDEGGTTRYQVRTRAGQTYFCSVGVAASVLGRTVTDALCTRKGEALRNPLLR